MLASAVRLGDISGRNVIFYASDFLQKPAASGYISVVNMEDINGFMACVHGLDYKKDLLLILHTPGGMAEASQSIVDYLWSKFSSIHVLIPTVAMSAGTMIALASDEMILGGHSQVGPADPHIRIGNMACSAHSVVQQFEEAKSEIIKNPAASQAWLPVIHSLSPALLQECRKAIAYSETLVQKWLQEHMFSGRADAETLAMSVAKHFAGSGHGSHGRRIGREEARDLRLAVRDLESDQALQEESLTTYHLATIAFKMTSATKIFLNSNGGILSITSEPQHS